MTQPFTLREPDSDLVQAVFTSPTMMPPWKQQSDVARFNLLHQQNEGDHGALLLEKPGQKRRRSFTLPTGQDHQFPVYHENSPNERASNDSSSVQLNGFEPTGGSFYGALQESASLSFPEERRGYYARMLESASYGIFPFRAPEPVVEHNVANPTPNSSVFLGRNHATAATDFLGRSNAGTTDFLGRNNAAAATDLLGHASAANQYGNHHRSSLDSAAAATAQAMANFQALIDQGRSTSLGFQAYNNGSNHGSQGSNVTTPTSLLNPSFAYRGNESFTPSFSSGGAHGQHQFNSNQGSSFSLNPSFGLPTTTTASGFNTNFNPNGNPSGFHDTNFSVSHPFGDPSVNEIYGAANGVSNSETTGATAIYGAANSEATIWPNLTCQTGTSARNNPPLFPDPQSPCTPRGNQTINTILTDSQKDYLHQIERLNSEAQIESDSPHQSSRQSRRLPYNNLFPSFQELDDASQPAEKQHLHVYFDESGIPEHVSVEDSADVAAVQVDESAEENFSQSFEPMVEGGKENARSVGDQFDLNEVPGVGIGGGVGEGATPPKPRKKYHPRVAKDKRTYKRKSDGKKGGGGGGDGFTNTDSPAKKSSKKRTPQYVATHEECRDTSYQDVVDMDIEVTLGATMGATPHASAELTPHNTFICDCEACIKFRLERRNSAGQNLDSTSRLDLAFDKMPQSPVSPIERHSRGSDPWDNSPDSSSDSPSVRRTLFHSPPESDCNQASNDGALTATTRTWPLSNAMVLSQSNANSYANVRSFATSTRVPSSCLQHFNESATRLGFSWNKPVGATLDWDPNPKRFTIPGQAASTGSTFMSRLCPRGILAPQKIPFREMNQVQRVLYLRSMLNSNLQLKMSPESLLRHVHDHLPEDEKELFKLSLWPIILKPLTEDQMKQLQEYADSSEQSVAPGAMAVEVVRRKPGPKPKKQQAAKKELAMTLWPDLVQESPQQKTTPKPKGRKSKSGVPTGLEMVPYEGNNGEKSMVPYENKPVVPYEGPFNPLRKRKPRPKVVLDGETVRVWKLLMGKTTGDANVETEADAENRVKWEEERRKMKAQALLFIERMHIVQGDRSFSCWKGSVVDSVVGAFLTQNVNDVLSSSAFMSMRSRFPGRGFRNSQTQNPDAPDAPDDTVAQSFDDPPSPAPTDNSPPDLPPPRNLTITTTVLESQESRNEAQDDHIHTPTPSKQQPGPQPQSSPEANSSPWRSQNPNQNHEESAASTISSTVSEVTNQLEESNSTVPPPRSGSSTDAGSEMGRSGRAMVEGTNRDGKYNAKTGLTGLERAKIEEKQVTARKSFDFAGLQEAFQPRVKGATRAPRSPRTPATEDGVDWEAVRRADVRELADVIKERGLNWILAGRIKAFLERIHLDYGALDLEWLRSMSTDQTKEFLLSIRGLGLKSVECIRLLTLHHLAFPVDTNVGRICVRLGWVPLEPLPEELQLHLLELYPVQATIQKYLWPRLCKLDQQTLYELHYQMITFGKVFCTKSKPNCNACPMRPECKHFASALSSAKLALPASERPNNGPTLALPPGTTPAGADLNPGESTPIPEPPGPRPVSQYYCQPIVEEPMTPESEADMEEFDIEDYPFSIEEVEDDADLNICIQNQVIQSQSNNNSHYSYGTTASEPTSEPMSELTSELISEPISEPTSELISEEPISEPLSEPSSVIISEPVEESDTIIMEDWGGLATSASNSVQLGVDFEGGCCAKSAIEITESVCEEVLDVGSNYNVGETMTSGEVLIHLSTKSSHEMVLVAPGVASLPVPKLKNVGRLRTVHYVYELPDNHPLLDGLDPKEEDDPCTYLLAIWSPGEVPESIPNMNDIADEENPFAASSFEGEENIKATLLVPCRTAMRGSFPLNGTYFQVNEVFADHASSLQPMIVPRTLLWNLRRRFVFFGTSVTSIFRGMTVEEIQACFWRGYVCVRGFDRATRAPKPLVGRLHLQAGKSSGKGANAEP